MRSRKKLVDEFVYEVVIQELLHEVVEDVMREEKEKLDIDLEAQEVLDGSVELEEGSEKMEEGSVELEESLELEESQKMEESSSRTKEKPYGEMSQRSHRRYKAKLNGILMSYTLKERLDLVMCLAAAFSYPSLPSPLRPSKLAIYLPASKLKEQLKYNK